MPKKAIEKAIKDVTGVTDIELSIPENELHGDYTTNIAMIMFANFQNPNSNFQSSTNNQFSKYKNPRELANELVTELQKDKELYKVVEKIDVAGPGFVNFWLKKDVLFDTLLNINSHIDTFAKVDVLAGKRIMIEFGQPNTHKLPHIGHLFSYIYGESVARLLEANGAEVFRANYQGDVGLHVAKCLWAIREIGMEEFRKVEAKSLPEKAAYLQKMYQEGSKAYDENENAKTAIQSLNKQIYEKDVEAFPLWEVTRGWSVEYYKEFEKRLEINYDRYFYESQVYKEGVEIVERNLNKVFKKSEGAVIFEGSKRGLHDRVFVTRYGTPTYEAKDLYLEQLKYKEWPFDLLIITTANEQSDYFKVVYKAIEEVEPNLTGKLKHIGFGMVNLKSGKMSSRTGNIISAIELVDAVVDRVRQLGSTGETTEIVGIGAVKYSFLKNNPLQDTRFSLEESIAAEGNSGPYLQYTYARTHSVLAKARANGKWQMTNSAFSVEHLALSAEELVLVRILSQFPEIIAAAAKNYSPNTLCNYLFNLAQKYNSFYNSNKILGGENEEFRLILTSAVANILKKGLYLLGISSPAKM